MTFKAFLYDDEVDRIEFPDDQWVDILKKMSYGDKQKLVASYMAVEQKLKGVEGGDLGLDIETGNIALLKINIKGWSFIGKDGKKVAPVNREYVERLDDPVTGKLLEEINRRNPAPKV